MDFTGKTAIVTGAAVGVGKATAIQLASYGANVVMVDRNEETLEKAKAAILQQEGIMTAVCDVTDAEAVTECVKKAVERFGKVDILVNNAGIWRTWRSFLDTSIEEWKQYIDVNVMGTVHFTKAALPGMLERGWGRIVNVASVAGVYGNANMVHYSATKGAILSFTKALAKEVADRGVTVNSTSPGMVNSSKDPDIDATQPNGASYVGRTGSARENAELICFLASEKAAFISGQNVQIDGCRKSI
jgi:3-oxoacyl-[acyl-carrier protein] reductase